MQQDLFRGRLVRLAAPRQDDTASLARWSHDAGYQRAVDTDYARPRPPEAFEQQGGDDAHAVEFRLRTLEGDVLIGFVVLHSIEWNNRAAVLSIGIGEAEYRGKGYGGDALRLILRYAFDELNLERVGLDVISNNEAAIRAYERAGFRHEGTMRHAVLRDGVWHDRLIMGILRPEWRA
ncbi:MAG: GNAT family N-acetyltransferase [Anaerolineae bacterium]|jgi:RimJ/RimL family protein N-acetyltransferase